MNYIKFNEKNIWYKRIDDTNYIIVKSVCEALNVYFNRQKRELTSDVILGAKVSKQTCLIPGDSQPRQYLCILEEYVYGWVLQIRSDKPELIRYKEECYHVLYKHFHRSILKRSEIYKEIDIQETIISDFETKISKIDGYDEYEKAKSKKRKLLKQANMMTDDQNELFY